MTTHLPNHPFRHRSNPDGSWDSICMRCYLTAATSKDEQSLNAGESEHRCYGHLRKSMPFQAATPSIFDSAR
jgi:hypothetical protein